MLLIDALSRGYEISKSIGSFAVVVDPLDEEAEKNLKGFSWIVKTQNLKYSENESR